MRPVAQVALYGAIAIDSLGTGLFAPLALLYFLSTTPMSVTTIGALTSLGVLVSLPVPFVAGSLADRFGARAVVIGGQALQAAGFAAYTAVRQPAPVLVAIAAVAVGQRLFWSTFFTMVADIPGDEGAQHAMDRRFAKVGMLQAAGLGLGALMAGAAVAVNDSTTYLVISAVNAGSFAVSGVLLTVVPTRVGGSAVPTASRASTGYRRLLTDWPYLALVAANVPYAICSVLLAIALPLYVAEGLDARGWIIGPLLALNTVVLATGQLLATRVVRAWSRTSALTVAGLVWTVWGGAMASATLFAWPLTAGWLVLAVLLYAAAEVMHAPVSNALAAAAAPEADRGRYLAVFQYGFTIATLVVPIGFTALFTVSPQLPWVVAATIALLASVAMQALHRYLPEHATDAPTG